MFVNRDFDTLGKILSNFSRIVVTPNILTEVSNLSGRLEGAARTQCFESLKTAIVTLDERVVASTDATADGAFLRLGLTDAAMSRLAQSPLPVLTTDFDLWRHLTEQRIDALNFNHIRTLGW